MLLLLFAVLLLLLLLREDSKRWSSAAIAALRLENNEDKDSELDLGRKGMAENFLQIKQVSES